MKKIYLTMVFLYPLMYVYAQDVITTKEGDEIESKVTKISSSDIEYKKWSNIDGPTYTIEKTKVFMIKYQNGEKEVFKSETPNANNGQQKEIKIEADANNAELIASFNDRIYELAKTITPKPTKQMDDIIAIWGISNNSVLSSKEIEVTFEPFKDKFDIRKYVLTVKNKTDNILYVDLGNCFCNWDGEEYYRYFNDESTSVTNGRSGGIAMPLIGGIGLGLGSSQSVSTTYKQQRIVAIPPHGVVPLTKDNYIREKGENVNLGRSEDFKIQCSLEQGRVLKTTYGEIVTFSETNSPAKKKNYLLTYSSTENFQVFSQLRFQTYLREAIGYERDNIEYDENLIKNIDNHCLIGVFKQY